MDKKEGTSLMHAIAVIAFTAGAAYYGPMFDQWYGARCKVAQQAQIPSKSLHGRIIELVRDRIFHKHGDQQATFPITYLTVQDANSIQHRLVIPDHRYVDPNLPTTVQYTPAKRMDADTLLIKAGYSSARADPNFQLELEGLVVALEQNQ